MTAKIRQGALTRGGVWVGNDSPVMVNVRADMIRDPRDIGSAWSRLIVLDRVPGDMDDNDLLEALGVARRHYAGPGQSYTNGPTIWHSTTRTAISQSGGWDI